MKFVKMHGTGNDFVVLSPPQAESRLAVTCTSLCATAILASAPTA